MIRRAQKGIMPLAVVVLAVWVVILANSRQEEVDRLVVDNRSLTCAISRLVAFVPAIQFEGEPRENFIGWLRSRRDMLEIARASGHCSEETVALLAERVRLDTEMLGDS